jgi:hypothetical protein
MKSKLIIAIIFACTTAHAWALERTVALPYDYSRSANQVYVPSCTASQYVGVSGTQFVCKDIPNCAIDEPLTRQGDVFRCMTKVELPAECGSFETSQVEYLNGKVQSYKYKLKVINGNCNGMTTTTQNGYTLLDACPNGYSLSETGRKITSYNYAMQISCESCRGSSGNGDSHHPQMEAVSQNRTINYICKKQ